MRKETENQSSLCNPERHRGILSTENCCLAENDGMFFRTALKNLYWWLHKATRIMCNKDLKWEAKTSSFVFHGGQLHLLQYLCYLFLWLQPHTHKGVHSTVKNIPP